MGTVKEMSPVLDISRNGIITFVPITKTYGRAQFHICPVFNRGRMADLYIYIVNPPDGKQKGFHLPIKTEYSGRVKSFQIQSKDIYAVPVWRHFWCLEHRTICFDVYAPKETYQISFDFHFGDLIEIKFS